MKSESNIYRQDCSKSEKVACADLQQNRVNTRAPDGAKKILSPDPEVGELDSTNLNATQVTDTVCDAKNFSAGIKRSQTMRMANKKTHSQYSSTGLLLRLLLNEDPPIPSLVAFSDSLKQFSLFHSFPETFIITFITIIIIITIILGQSPTEIPKPNH